MLWPSDLLRVDSSCIIIIYRGVYQNTHVPPRSKFDHSIAYTIIDLLDTVPNLKSSVMVQVGIN